MPAWLNIDYRNNLWAGEYGWPASDTGYRNTKQVRGQAILAEGVSKKSGIEIGEHDLICKD
ncbi:MAG TPA: hypothetical protein ENJ87_07405 [Gammaproteobacteria bacterium]|nr:hypothetical protein [Gammaproteobacteria bacterium]